MSDKRKLACEYEKRPQVAAAIKLLRNTPLLNRAIGWATFRTRLYTTLYLLPYPGRSWSVPIEFIYAYKRVCAKWTREQAYSVVEKAVDTHGDAAGEDATNEH